MQCSIRRRSALSAGALLLVVSTHALKIAGPSQAKTLDVAEKLAVPDAPTWFQRVRGVLAPVAMVLALGSFAAMSWNAGTPLLVAACPAARPGKAKARCGRDSARDCDKRPGSGLWHCALPAKLCALISFVLLATMGCISGLVGYIGAEHISCATVGRLRKLGKLGETRCDEGRPRDVGSLVSDPLILLNTEVPALPGGVTKIFHQIALCSPSAYGCSSQDSRRLSPHMWKWVESWNRLHKGWLHVFWTDVEVRWLLEHRHPEAVDLFERYPHAVMRADMARAYILSAFGGIYADIDYEALSSIEPFIMGRGLCMLDSPYKKWEDVQNSLMASRPGHPFWTVVFRLLRERQPKLLQFEVDILKATGPGMLSDALAEYERTGGAGAAADGECRFEVDRLMFGMNTSDGPGAALHHYAHSWSTEDTRDDIRRISGCVVIVCAFVLLGLWLCMESHKQFMPWWAAG